MTIKKKKPLPECKDRYFEPAADGFGGVIKGVRIPCCPLTRTYGNINCYAILGAGKCPHEFDYPREHVVDVTTFKVSGNFKKELEEEEKEIERDNEMLAYLNEIDPLDD